MATAILLGLEAMLGYNITSLLTGTMERDFFGNSNAAQIMMEKPALFERAMKDILGSAGLILLMMAYQKVMLEDMQPSYQ